jgi:surfactin synthase thioesterase subunit
VYRQWPDGLPDEIELCAVQLPGRENRLGEAALSSIPAIVDALMPAFEPALDLPYALFGHSMGAIVASEAARALGATGKPLPDQLIVSSRRPASVPDPDPPLRSLRDAEFVSEISRRYGGIPAEVIAQADLLALLLPCLRADLTALETFQPGARAPLPCPISVFGGADDARVPRAHLEAWRSETSGAFRVRVFAGKHFYLTTRRADVLADISALLAPLLAPRLVRERVG